MYEENDYIMRQIKSMVRGLGKFMGLEQIKELLQLTEDQQVAMTDNELETIIAVSKIQVILANRQITHQDIAKEINLETNRVNRLIHNEVIATQDELNQLNRFIDRNTKYL